MITSTWVNDHASGFIDHNQIMVLIHNIKRNGFCTARPDGLIPISNDNPVPLRNMGMRLHRMVIERDLTRFNQLLDFGPRQFVPKRPGKKGVEARVGA